MLNDCYTISENSQRKYKIYTLSYSDPGIFRRSGRTRKANKNSERRIPASDHVRSRLNRNENVEMSWERERDYTDGHRYWGTAPPNFLPANCGRHVRTAKIIKFVQWPFFSTDLIVSHFHLTCHFQTWIFERSEPEQESNQKWNYNLLVVAI